MRDFWLTFALWMCVAMVLLGVGLMLWGITGLLEGRA